MFVLHVEHSYLERCPNSWWTDRTARPAEQDRPVGLTGRSCCCPLIRGLWLHSRNIELRTLLYCCRRSWTCWNEVMANCTSLYGKTVPFQRKYCFLSALNDTSIRFYGKKCLCKLCSCIGPLDYTVKLLFCPCRISGGLVAGVPTAAARVRARVKSLGICGGQIGTGAASECFDFPCLLFIPPTAPQSSSSSSSSSLYWVGVIGQ
jgi:hypothetical protein